MDNTNKKNFTYVWAILGVVAVILAGAYWRMSREDLRPIADINSFEECAAAGYPILETYPEQCKTPDGRTFTKIVDSQNTGFGQPVTFGLGEKVDFIDGLQVILVEINDSRCKDGVMCIWAGELSPLLRVTGGNAGKSLKEVRLGTTTIKSATANGYTFTLNEATETTAAITVTTAEDEQVFCTQDVKMCPDDSYVSRTGPNCEFAECPVN